MANIHETCGQSFRTENGLEFHRSWCGKPRGTDPLPPAVELRHEWPTPPEWARLVDRPSVDELVSADAPKAAPKAGKVVGPKVPKVGAGKHARCVHHEPMARTAPGVAYACFDQAPSAEDIADRAAFVAVVDASWNAMHEREMARQAALPPVLTGVVLPPLHVSRLLSPEEREAARKRDAIERDAIRAELAEGSFRCPLNRRDVEAAAKKATGAGRIVPAAKDLCRRADGFASVADLALHVAYRHPGYVAPSDVAAAA